MAANTAPVPGGFILFSRRFIELLADMPLLDRTLWVWLYCKANHSNQAGLARGELVTTIDEMRDAMRYRVGYRTIKPSEKELRRALERLYERNTIVPHKTTRGLVITICDYDLYQNKANYECLNERATDVPTKGQEGAHYKQECNKNEKNEGGGKPTSFSFKSSYMKTFDEMDRERASQARQKAIKEFLANEHR
jgi:hypothetical protein